MMRTYWRQRNDLVQSAGRHIQRIQKALTQMNLQLANVLMDQLQAVAMNEGYRWKKKLFSEKGRGLLEKLPLAPWASRHRKELLELLDQLDPKIAELTAAVEQEAEKRPEVVRLMSHPGVGPTTGLVYVLVIGTRICGVEVVKLQALANDLSEVNNRCQKNVITPTNCGTGPTFLYIHRCLAGAL